MNEFAEPGELQNLCGSYPKGIEVSPQRMEQFLELLELARDICSPEGYGHAMPAEVVRRAARILKLDERIL